MAGEKNGPANRTKFLIVVLLEAFDGWNRILSDRRTSEEKTKIESRALKFTRGTLLSDGVNSREKQKRVGKSAEQANRMAGPIHFAANEFEPFQAHRLGLGAHLDRKPRHNPRCWLWWRHAPPDSQ